MGEEKLKKDNLKNILDSVIKDGSKKAIWSEWYGTHSVNIGESGATISYTLADNDSVEKLQIDGRSFKQDLKHHILYRVAHEIAKEDEIIFHDSFIICPLIRYKDITKAIQKTLELDQRLLNAINMYHNESRRMVNHLVEESKKSIQKS